MANKYNLDNILKEKYQKCVSTFKETSLDDRNRGVENYLCEDTQLEIYDFDCIKNIIDKTKKSPDSLYIHDKTCYIIEFKNQNPKDIVCNDIKEKFQFSRDFLNDYSLKDYKYIICLVYKNQTIQKDSQRYKQRLQNIACCCLDDVNKNDYKNFYSNIITRDVNFYKNNFKELSC
jgi:hypothetical protein